MLSASILQSVAHQLDRWVLYTMNMRLPNSFEESYRESPAFEAVLERTEVDRVKTAEYALSAPGEHNIWLNTTNGDLLCHVRVRPAPDPGAPLVLYHHGFNEMPYYHSWQRIFREPAPFPAHTVCVQAPFHSRWTDPFDKGFASLQSVYQMFAGSLRVMELIQSHFTAQGSAYTVLAGVSWGGITSLLYESLFQRTHAVIPMLSSPDLAQVMWDIADLFDRPIAVTKPALKELLDFTPYYQQCDATRVFPLMGERDLFFRLENHSAVFADRPIVTIPDGHITGFWRIELLREHILNVLRWTDANAV